jgi:hypothetical protein
LRHLLPCVRRRLSRFLRGAPGAHLPSSSTSTTPDTSTGRHRVCPSPHLPRIGVSTAHQPSLSPRCSSTSTTSTAGSRPGYSCSRYPTNSHVVG